MKVRVNTSRAFCAACRAFCEPSAPGAVARETILSQRKLYANSEERLRLVRRATGLGMYEVDWVGRRRYWSPELRAILRAPADLDINSDVDLLERIIPADTCSRFREKLQASLQPESGGDCEDEHRITRFDGSTGWTHGSEDQVSSLSGRSGAGRR